MIHLYPFLVVDWDEFCGLPSIDHVLLMLNVVSSLSSARRLIGQGAVRVGSKNSVAGERIERDPTNLLQLVDTAPSPSRQQELRGGRADRA